MPGRLLAPFGGQISVRVQAVQTCAIAEVKSRYRVPRESAGFLPQQIMRTERFQRIVHSTVDLIVYFTA